MCGRFSIYDLEEFKDYYNLEAIKEDLKPRYNAAPGQQLPVITKDKTNQLKVMRWGLIPFWAKDEKIGYKLINARQESIFDKPTWRNSIRKKRCLVPTNGFYEWKAEKDIKQPYFIHPKKRKLFSFAGLFDSWTNKDTGEIINSFSIVTTEPNKEMEPIHNRMPVILDQADESSWLDPSTTEETLSDLMIPYHNNSLEIYPVDRAVGNAHHDYPELIQRMPA